MDSGATLRRQDADGSRQETERNPETNAPAKRENAKRLPAELQLDDFRKKVNKDILKKANMSEEDFQKFLKAYKAYLQKQGVENSKEEELAAPHLGSMAAPNQQLRQIDASVKVKSGDPERTGPALPPPQFREAQKEFSRRLSNLNPARDQK
jgi:hypothetical protein